MKKGLLTLVWVSCMFLSQAQTGLQFPFLGQPASAFKDSILCKDFNKLDKPWSTDLNCGSYLVTPSSAIYRYGEVEFPVVIIYPDKTAVIQSFSHYKSFFKGAEGQQAKDIKALLVSYFDKLFGEKGVTSKVKGRYSDEHMITWKGEAVKIILQIGTFKKRKKGQVYEILDLYISREK